MTPTPLGTLDNRITSLFEKDARVLAHVKQAALALHNASAGLREKPAIASFTALPGTEAERVHDAALIALLELDKFVVHGAIGDAAKPLVDKVLRVFTEPEAAIVNDPGRMREAAEAWVRQVIDDYRRSLLAALPTLLEERGR